MRSLSLDDVLVRAADVRFRAVGEETVALRQQAAEILVLNEVGGRLLALLDGRRPLAACVEVLVAEFEVSREVASRDVLGFAERLLAEGMATAPAERQQEA